MSESKEEETISIEEQNRLVQEVLDKINEVWIDELVLVNPKDETDTFIVKRGEQLSFENGQYLECCYDRFGDLPFYIKYDAMDKCVYIGLWRDKFIDKLQRNGYYYTFDFLPLKN